MRRKPALQDRISAGILETAATVLAEHGGSVSMNELAEAAGVGRATLYRYFPTRDALFRGLAEAAYGELRERIAEAELDSVPVREGVARVARCFLTAASRYAALLHTDKKHLGDPAEVDRNLAQPVRDLLARGTRDGTLRSDLTVDVLFTLFTGLLEKALDLVLRQRIGVEQGSSALVTMFLDGARAR